MKMKAVVTTLILTTLMTACSSQTRSAKVESKNSSVRVKEDEAIGKELPDWVNRNEVKDGRVYVVGYSEMSADKSPYHVTKAALMDGEIKLLSDAPADIRVMTQNSLTGAGIDSSEFFEIQTKLKEVFAVEGFKQHENTCRKIVRYGETQVRAVRGCWYRVSADLMHMKKAYAFTLSLKYGQGKASKFESLMQQEIEKINDHKRYQDEDNGNN